MTNEEALTLAKDTYNTLIETFQQTNWPYQESQNDLTITCSASGEDLPMNFVITVEPDNMQIRMFSQLPFTIPDDKRVDMAVAICMVNNFLVAGCFDYDVKSDKMYFRIENSYRESPINNEIIVYMVNASIGVVDKYNDKFYMLATNMISLEKFTESIMGGN